MARRHLLDAHGGIIRTFEYDEASDTVILGSHQDCNAIIDNNKRLAAWNDGFNADRDMRRVASIPMILVEKWMKEDGVNLFTMPKAEKTRYLRRKLADPEYRYLRTSPGGF